ncbi:MAG: LamG domain-containing protein, partial [Nanoarchaeota archaeon]
DKKVVKIDRDIDKLKGRKREGLLSNVELKDINSEIIEKTNERNTITGYSIKREGKGFLTKLFEWLFNVKITTYAVLDTEESNVTQVIIDEQVSEVEVEYYTEGPTAEEINVSGNVKRVIVSSDVHYENILTYSYLEPQQAASAIKLYWLVNGSRREFEFESFDTDSNGLVDYIQWVTPSLSNQTFEIVIEITDAEHLDSDRSFVSDVYEYVKERDDNWTEIPDGHYVRVRFEQELDDTRDITVYARANSSSIIEIYEENGTEIIATFEDVYLEGEYKVYLSELEGVQDTFDLKVLGDVEFDYIVDPSIDFTAPTLDDRTITDNNHTEINVTITESNLEAVVYNWNGDNYTFYDNNILLLMNFENITSLGENNTYFADASSYGNNGTAQNFEDDEIISAGKFGNAINLDGIDDYISITRDVDWETSDDLTLMFWFNISVIEVSDILVARWAEPTVSDGRIWCVAFEDASGNLRFDTSPDGSFDAANKAVTTMGLSIDIWYHGAFVHDSTAGTNKIYINGVLNGTASGVAAGLSTEITDIQIGDAYFASSTNRYFAGSIDEVRVYNRTMSAEEINQSYMSNLKKYDTDKWEFYINQSKSPGVELPNGTYTYQVWAEDTSNNWNTTGLREIGIGGTDNFEPDINFTYPTPDNDTTLYVDYIDSINISIYEPSLKEVIYNWNGTNFTYYNDSLLLMMNFDNRSGLGENDNYVVDISGKGNNGSCSLCPVFNPIGKYDGAYEFNGTTGYYISIQDDDSLDLINSNFTIAVWFNANRLDDDAGILDKGANTNSGYSINLFNNALRFYTDSWVGSLDVNVSADVWYYAAYVFSKSSNNLTLYLNGAYNRSQTDASPTNNALPLTIGRYWGDSWIFNGTIDEVRIWNRSLTAGEIYQQYVSNLNKYNQTQWYLIVNQSRSATAGLTDSVYTYYSCASDSSLNENCTETRTIEIDAVDTVPPNVNFTIPTIYNNSYQNTPVLINISVVESSLGDIVFDFNNVNETTVTEGDTYTILNFTESSLDNLELNNGTSIINYYNDSLIFMMNFDNVSSIGEGFNRTVDVSKTGSVGNCTVGYDCPTWTPYGKYGGAYEYNGNDIIEATLDGTGFDLFTMSFWIKLNYTPSSEVGILNWERVPGDAITFIGLFKTTTKTNVQWFLDTDYRSELAINNNTWAHIALTYDNTTWRAYVNGTLQASYAIDNRNQGSAQKLLFGDGFGGRYTGYIDEAMVFNRNLTDEEIKGLYVSNLRKFDTDRWQLYVNHTDSLDSYSINSQGNDNVNFVKENASNYYLNMTRDYRITGTYDYYACASDSLDNENCTETKTIRLDYDAPVNFTLITLANHSNSTEAYVEINISVEETIEDDRLVELIYNWNGTNYTMYNDSLVLMMNFDNVSALGENSTYVVDLSYGSNNASCLSCPSFVLGKFSGAYYFDSANNQYFNTSRSWGDLITSSTGTISIWLKPTGDSPTISHAYDAQHAIGDWSGGWLEITRGTIGGADRIWVYNYDGSEDRVGIPYTNDEWTYVTLVHTGGQLYGYKNGALVGSIASGNTGDMAGDILIGAGYRLGLPWNGSIDEVRIWNRTLSADEVYQQYVSNLYKYNQTQWYLYVNQSKNATTLLTDNIYTYQAFATDVLGNQNDTGVREVIVNVTPRWDQYPANATIEYYSESLSIDFNASDNDPIMYFVNDTTRFNITSGDGILTNGSFLQLGTYEVNVSVNDTSNNINSTIYKIVVNDTTYPLINFTEPTLANNTLITNTSILVNVSIEETNLGEVVYNWDGTNYTLYNDSLLLMLNFDNVSALGDNRTYAVDLSKYGNDGLINGDGDEYAIGRYGMGFTVGTDLIYDITDKYDYAFVEDKDMWDMEEELTVSAWFKGLNSYCNQDALVVHDVSQYKWMLGCTQSVYNVFYFGISTLSGYSTTGSSSPYDMGEWHHVVGTFDKNLASNRLKIYVDGVLQSQSDAYGESILEGDEGVYVGVNDNEAQFGTPGVVDEVRIWNRTLTAQEIYQEYASNLNKYDNDTWYLYVNQSQNVSEGVLGGMHTYQAFAEDMLGNQNATEIRYVNVSIPPVVNFTEPTLANGTNVSTRSVEINVSIDEDNLNSVIYNWDGTNY